MATKKATPKKKLTAAQKKRPVLVEPRIKPTIPIEVIRKAVREVSLKYRPNGEKL